MNNYSRLNNFFGWCVFLLAATVYFKTMEPTVSFWDCGEFIAAAFRLQVGHEPGAPVFILLGKVFSLLAGSKEQVAFMMNTVSVLASAATILFLFWTITALAKRLVCEPGAQLTVSQAVAIFGAGAVGSLAYTFSDTFWFSAVESEVYALSTLITAVTFWAILKWEARGADKWLVFIAFITGLSIGVHLLNLLTIPAITLVYYYKRAEKTSWKGGLLALAAGCGLLVLIQYGVILYLVKFAFYADLLFVNSFHLPFGSGALFFASVLIASLVWSILYSIRNERPALNLALNCMVFILLGYSSYAMIMIRASAKPPVNISNPDNMFSLFRYLGREQYGSNPLIYGNYFDSQVTGTKGSKTLYARGAGQYVQAGQEPEYNYDRNTLFPRVYSQRPGHAAAYRSWLGLPAGAHPGFQDNLTFFTTYQAGFMYLRYFLWNFSGKQNDIQGQGELGNGNWITGIKAIDHLRLGNQQQLPESIVENPGHNRFYALPLILGIAGIIYQFRKNRKDAAVLGTLFFSTGLAIVLYLNMDPLQVRDRDYVFVGSFYTFAIWIGIGVLSIRTALSRITAPLAGSISAVALCAVAVPFLMGKDGWNDHDRSNRFTARDMAANYLNSCAPNAILFTDADNDTYPLWYAQYVEGIRKDVRVVNLELLHDESYLTSMKKPLFGTKGLPLTMNAKKYSRGERDYLPYVNYGLTDSVELKDLLAVLLSDNDADKIDLNDGSRSNFLPSKKWKLTVDPREVIGSGTTTATLKDQLAPEMQWNYNKDYVTRADLAVMDVLVNNHWKRPVYFTVGLSGDSYMGLDKYLYTEGYAYRLLPFKRAAADTRDKSEIANTPVMADNLMNKFRYSFKQTAYLDPESRNILSMTWGAFNNLADNLINEGDQRYSKVVMDKAMRSLPLKNYDLADTLNKYGAANNYFRLGENARAGQLLNSAVSFLGSELNYYASLDEQRQRDDEYALSRVAVILQGCKELALKYKQDQLVSRIDGICLTAQKTLVFDLKS